MGLAVSLLEIEKNQGKICMPDRPYVPFPTNRRGVRGKVCQYYFAKPPTMTLPREPESLFWWVDGQFIPYDDSTIVQSVGAYEARPFRTPITITNKLHGFIYFFTFKEGKSKVDFLRGSSGTSSMPNIQMHPSGDMFLHAATGQVRMTSIQSLDYIRREKDVRQNCYRFCTCSPDGLFIATIAKCSKNVELGILCNGPMHNFSDMGYVNCHNLCKNFYADRSYVDTFECKFSANGCLVAVSSSHGLIFVAKRNDLTAHCNIIPGMFDVAEELLSGSRAFDFDPRYTQRLLAIGTENQQVIICDVDEHEEGLRFDVPTEGEIQVIKYNNCGQNIAVATSEASIYLFDPDNGTQLYCLDGTLQDVGPAMQKRYNDLYPEFIRLSFSTSGDLLSSTSTDGMMRIWQLEPDLSLQHMCRMAIMKHTRLDEIKLLPLPTKVILYLLQWPTNV